MQTLPKIDKARVLRTPEARFAHLAVLQQWQKPFLTLFSSRDPITRGGEKVFQKMVPGAHDQAHSITRSAGHFLQEDKGPELAQQIAAFIARTQAPHHAPPTAA